MERIGTLDPILVIEPRKKIEKPRLWQVIMKSGAEPPKCALCTLRDVFNMPLDLAKQHVRVAAEKGKVVVFEGSADVAQTKAYRAKNRVIRCGQHAVEFTAQPQP
jgi:ATP-dependent Clp protease adapter protein ClpS